MELIKNIFIDSLNGFSAKYIPLFLFQLLSAGVLAHLLQWILNKKTGTKELSKLALIAVAIALITSIVKYQLPFAIMGAACFFLLIKEKDRSRIQSIGLFLTAVIGVGCGVGSVVQTVIGALLIGLIILFLPFKNE